MKLGAVQRKQIEVEIDPSQVIQEIKLQYLTNLGMPLSAYVEDGNWVHFAHEYIPDEFIRTATPDEIEHMMAFKIMARITYNMS